MDKEVQEQELEVTATETVEVEEPEQVDQEGQDEEAGFLAAFGEARADEAPAAEDEQEVEQEASDEVAKTEEAQQEVLEQVQQEAEAAGYSEEEVKALIAKVPEIEKMTSTEIRKVFGRIGEMNREMQELKNSIGKGGSLKLDATKLKRLNEEYPEIAQILAEDLSEALVGTGAESQPAADVQEIINQRVAEATAQTQREMMSQLLTVYHKDWATVVQTQEFQGWVGTLPKDEQQKISSSWDAIYLGDKLSEYKTWLASKKKVIQQKEERLKNAITPKGAQQKPRPAAMTEEDGFNAVFQN